MSRRKTKLALETLEVVATICRFVSDGAYVPQEFTMPLYSLQPPTVSRHWTKIIAPLVRVNRTFGHVCVPILWRTLDTLKPLVVALGGERTCNSDGSSYWSFPHGISRAQWESFGYYSSKIKILVLKPDERTLDVSWLAFVSSTIPQHISWFPAVKRVYLNSVDPFALFLSTSLMPHVKTACINLPSQTHADIAILGAARQNQSMVGLRVEHLASLQTLRAVSALRHLKYLFIKIPADTPTSMLVDSINSLQLLMSLAIRQDQAELGSDNPLSMSNGYNTAIARPSQHPNLSWLSINANAATQCIVAAHLAPTSLQSLDMIVFSHKDAVYIAPVIAIYCQRNPGLFSLKVEVMSDITALPEEVASLRDHTAFDAQQFLDALTTLTELRCLSIDGVPFFERHIVKCVLRAAHQLVHLTSLQFLPAPVTSLDSDELVPGGLMELVCTAESGPALGFIETLLDVSDIPSLGAQYDSDHRLEKLSVRTNGRPPKTIRDRLEVAKFLDTVFPYLKHVSSPIRDMEDGAESLIWGEVEEMVFSNQAIRADIWRKIGDTDSENKRRKVRFCTQ